MSSSATAHSGRVRKAVFPVAGLGTRFLPATKSVPKELLPIVDRPLIQYAVDEALAAGIEQMIFVTGRGKAAIQDYFDIAFEAEATQRERGKNVEALLGTTLPAGSAVFLRQQVPLGLGHAIWCAREVIGDEPFAVILPDEFVISAGSCIGQLISVHDKLGGNVIGTTEVPYAETANYGVIRPGKQRGALMEIEALVEKPPIGTAPSRSIIVGRYVLQPDIMDVLARQPSGAGGEIQLTDAMSSLLATQQFNALRINGRRFDCGSRQGFISANLAVALQRADLKAHIGDFLQRELAAFSPGACVEAVGISRATASG